MMRKTILPATLALAILVLLTRCAQSETERSEAIFQQVCSSCHVAPDPACLPKRLWEAQVLPEMGARLGIRVGEYDPVRGLSMEEVFHIDQTRVYPKEPLIDQEDWDLVYQYVLQMAPDTIPVDETRKSRSQALSLFKPHEIALDKLPGARITALHFDSLNRQWNIGNRMGEWYRLQGPDSSKLEYLFASALAAFKENDPATELVIEMGYMDPSDTPRGRLWQFQQGRRAVLAENLYRPVDVNSLDIDGDGKLEHIICEFGNRGGRLSLLQQDGNQFKKRSLLNLPGTIRTVVADMNRDQRPDLVLLAGQGDEGIYILYNQGKGDFSVKHPVRLPPIYGSSWFELFDYEGDGDLDIVIVNGDNADYSYALKPYHGFRIFLNDGKDNYRETFFYPIYGATRVLARDFDQDGDLDFAIAAIFPDFARNAEESFVYLENQDAANYRFQAHTTPAGVQGQWLVMDAGDLEGDGDIDILLGSYSDSPAPVPDSLRRRWNTANVDLLWLENTIAGPLAPQ